MMQTEGFNIFLNVTNEYEKKKKKKLPSLSFATLFGKNKRKKSLT